MPQLSLYIDEDTLKKIETGAKISNTSVSKFVSVILGEHFSKSWPAGFKSVFGSITDDSFTKPKPIDSALDAERESL